MSEVELLNLAISRIKDRLKGCSIHDDDASGLSQAIDILEELKYEILCSLR